MPQWPVPKRESDMDAVIATCIGGVIWFGLCGQVLPSLACLVLAAVLAKFGE
jgi:hypothetical protein